LVVQLISDYKKPKSAQFHTDFENLSGVNKLSTTAKMCGSANVEQNKHLKTGCAHLKLNQDTIDWKKIVLPTSKFKQIWEREFEVQNMEISDLMWQYI
jgi:hypothetical protein